MKYEVIVYTNTYVLSEDEFGAYEILSDIDEESYRFENLVEVRDWLFDEGFWYPFSIPDIFAHTWLTDERYQNHYTGRITDRTVHVVNGSGREWIAVIKSLLKKVNR